MRILPESRQSSYQAHIFKPVTLSSRKWCKFKELAGSFPSEDRVTSKTDFRKGRNKSTALIIYFRLTKEQTNKHS